MRKITALLLAIILVAGSVSVYAAEGFENTSSSWTISSGAAKIDDGTGNHVIELTGKNGKGIINKARKSGILSIQFEFKADESQNSAVLPEVYGIGKDGKEFKILEVLLKDNMVSFVCGTKENNIRANAETIVNQNNTVTVEIDTEKSLASVWLNGTPVAVNRKFINNTEIVSVSKVALRNTSSSSSVYIDNIEYIAEPAKGVERSVEIPEEDIIVSETFDGNSYSLSVPSGMEVVTREEAKTDNDMCLKISPATVGNYLNIALNNYSGILTYKFEVMADGVPNQVVLGELSGGGRLIPLSVYQKYLSVVYSSGSRQNTLLSESTWTTVEVQADSSENKFSLWIDNKLILDKADFFQNAKPGKFSLIQFGTKYENEPAIYVDSITVYKGERVEIVQKETYDVASALEKTEVFKKDSKIKYLSNYRKELTGVPFEENGELYVPLNEACEGFGIEYGYSSFDETAYISYQGNSVKVPANKDYIVFNDAKTDLKAKTAVKDGVLFASLSDAGKILSKEVYYDSENGIGYLTLDSFVKGGEELSSVNEFVLSLYGEELLPDKDLYVSINAKKSGDGSKDAPFKTIEEAKAEVKKLIAGKQTGNITVYVGKGTYYITQPLKFGGSDSHSGNYTVTYKKCDGENNPLIDAGERITGWKPYKNGIYVANLPKGANPLTLSEDGKRVTIARHPNEGYNRLDAADGGASKTDFKFREGAFPKVENPLELKWTIWPGSESGEINYSTNRELKTVEFDYSTRKVKIEGAATYVLGTGSRYYVYNAMEFLDEKGEYYVDTKESKIYYKPISDDIEKAVIVMPADYNAVEFKGSGTKPAQNIVFDGINVTGTNVKKNLIDIANARNIVIKNSKLYFSGNNGVNIGTNTSNCTVESNEIKGMGFYGIYAVGSGNGDLNCYGHRIINNHIDTVGELEGNAVGVRFAQTQYCVGRYNLVHNSPRNGFHIYGNADTKFIGTTINGVKVTEENARDFKSARNNTFEYNEAYDCINDSMDANVFGAWGVDYGNVLRKNLAHNTTLPQITQKESSSFWYSYYFDENSNGSYILSNISYDNQEYPGGRYSAALHNNNSDDTTISNNVFVEENAVVNGISINNMSSKASDKTHRSERVTVTKNIVSGAKDEYMVGRELSDGESLKELDRNLYYSPSNIYNIKSDTNFKTIQDAKDAGYELNSVTADPDFVNKEGKDFRLKYNSPAYLVGFEDINIGDMGLREDFPYSDESDEIVRIFPYCEGDYFKRAWVSLDIGETVKLKVDTRTKTGFLSKKDTVDVKCESDNTDIAKIDSDGNITAVNNGMANITVTAARNGKTLTSNYEVVIGDNQVKGVEISGLLEYMAIGETGIPRVLSVSGLGRKQNPLDYSIEVLTPDILSYENGVITAKAIGKGIVKATVGDVSGEFEVTVIKDKATSLAASLEKTSYMYGEKINPKIALYNKSGEELSLDGAVVTYSSASEDIVKVSDGELVAQNKTGFANITVSAKKDGILVTNTILVGVVGTGLDEFNGYKLFNSSRNGYNLTTGYVLNENGKARLFTTGHDAWSTQDAASYLLKETEGDLTVTGTVEEVMNPYSNVTGENFIHASGGITLRANMTDGSANVFVRYRRNGDVIMSYRETEGGETKYFKGSDKPAAPYQLKLTKSGNTFTGSYLAENGNWVTLGTVNITMSAKFYGGVGGLTGLYGDYNSVLFKEFNISK